MKFPSVSIELHYLGLVKILFILLNPNETYELIIFISVLFYQYYLIRKSML
jgi:hypothetical protein